MLMPLSAPCHFGTSICTGGDFTSNGGAGMSNFASIDATTGVGLEY